MSNLEDNINKEHSNYNKLYNLIDEEINEKKQEDIIEVKDFNKSMNQAKLARSNNFIQEEDKYDKKAIQKDKASRVSLNSKNNTYVKIKKTEIQPQNKNGMINQLIVDNPKEEEQKNADENIEEIPKKVISGKREYRGTKDEKIVCIPFSEYKIEPIINDSKYNIFFILSISTKLVDFLSLAALEKKYEYNEYYERQTYYILYQMHFIGLKTGKKFNEDLNHFLIQVPVQKETKNLMIVLKNDKEEDPRYADIDFKISAKNYFYPKNAFYYLREYNLTDNQIFAYYLDYFFVEKNTNDEKLRSDLILSLLYNIKKSDGYIELSGDIILRFIKYIFLYEFNLPELSYIKVLKGKIPINKDDYLNYEDLVNYDLTKTEKKEFIYLLVQIYALNDKDYLLSLLKGNLGSKYMEVILDLLNKNILSEYDIIFPNDEDNIFLQDNLLEFSQELEDVNSVLSLSLGLTKCLKYLNENYEQIYQIVFSKNYYLDLPKIDNISNYEDIYKLLIDLIKKSKSYKIQIIEFGLIFNDLMNYYANGTLEEFENLNDLLEELDSKDLITDDYARKYRKYLHRKGVQLIKGRALNINQIMEFIFKKDVYYYHKKYREYGDASIFFYIPITERDSNYETNIKEMRKNKIWELYSDEEKKIEMYNAFLEQINKITELRHIFELFPEDEINKNFCTLIREKIKEISGNIANEKPENFQGIFEILKTYLICSEKNGVTIKIPQVNYDFNFKLFQYILQENSLKKVVNKIEKLIISFFLELKFFAMV